MEIYYENNKKYNVIGIIKRVKKVTTKKGEEMAFVTLDCNNQYLDVVVFNEVYKDYKFIFTSKKLVLLNGLGRMREDNIQLQLYKAKEL
jgi:DNA polymerase-3 subunit alpha